MRILLSAICKWCIILGKLKAEMVPEILHPKIQGQIIQHIHNHDVYLNLPEK